ncbi:MAG: DUF6273 domain-containing protein, partial [Coprobacillus sp.]|nr:DUF6273 domain-containing protein [Coprobacillus sp.]
HALRTAKVMIVYGQKEEYFEAKWLKNEWGRFIRMIDEGIKEDGSLIVCYENMSPNNLPNRLKKLQCLNLSDKTSYITLDKVLNKLINESKKKIHTIEEVKIEKREIKKVTKVNTKNVEIYAFNDTIQEVTEDEETLLEIADDYLSKGKYIEAKEKYERVLLINKHSYKALFGIILATNKCNSKETFINNQELVSKNIKDIDEVIKVCDKETAVNKFIQEISRSMMNNIQLNNEKYCSEIFDYLMRYSFPLRNILRDKLIEYSINNSSSVMFNKAIDVLEEDKVDLHISYREKMQNSLIKAKKFEEAKELALDTLNIEEGNTTSLYNLFICYIGNRNIITSIDDEAYKLIDKIISYEKTPNDFVIVLINQIINTKYVSDKEKVLENLLKRIQNDNELRCNYSYKIANNLKDERQFDKAIKFYNYYLSDTKVNQELGYEGLLLCKYKCINAKELININEDFSKSNEYEKLLILSKRNNNELYKKYFNSKDKWIEKKKVKHRKVVKVSIISLVIVSIITSLVLYMTNSNNGKFIELTEPTETEEGIIGRYVFGIKMEEIIIPSLNDNEYNVTINKKSVCEEGIKTYTYTKDGKVYALEVIVHEKGHNFDSWKVDIAPTVKESGQISRICKNDSKHIETKELPILDNSNYEYKVIKEETCTEDGISEYRYIINDANGTTQELTFKETITHHHFYNYFKCTLCNDEREYYIEEGFLYFGSYPQTIKEDNIIITNTKQDEKGYFTGSDGEKYALLKADPCYNYYIFSNWKTIVKNQEYYFKVEPIKWKVLEDKDGKVFLLSELILDAHRFDDSSNDYSISSIRTWLNSEFYNKTFTDKQKELIENTTLEDISNVTDKVFLLSKDEIKNTSYGFNSEDDRFKKVTDYAKANFAYEYEDNNNGFYWLRTPYSSGVCSVWYNGLVAIGERVNIDNHGVAPALNFCKVKA